MKKSGEQQRTVITLNYKEDKPPSEDTLRTSLTRCVGSRRRCCQGNVLGNGVKTQVQGSYWVYTKNARCVCVCVVSDEKRLS